MSFPRIEQFDDFRKGAINAIWMPWLGKPPPKERFAVVGVDGVSVKVCVTVEPEGPASSVFEWHASASLEHPNPAGPGDYAMPLALMSPAQIKTLCKACILVLAGVGSDTYEVDKTRMGKAVHMRKTVVPVDWVNYTE